jgi:outer membrane protein OmpA-like peptidoglycan-associated protein
MRLKTPGKIAVVIVVVGLALGAYRLVSHGEGLSGLVPQAQSVASLVPKRADLPDASASGSTASSVSVTMPGNEAGCTDKPPVKLLGYAWNAQMGLLFANGGPQATSGSLMCKHGVNLSWERQDDNGKLQEALVAFATELSNGNPYPTKGANFVTVMGDGSAVFLKGLNDALKKLGPEYTAKVIGAAGYSRGEDKFMGPPQWKQDPSLSKGGVCAGVIRDGDWNIAQKWLGDNGLKTNPDEKTYDPDALNWVNANDYLDAGEKYISGYSEDRPVVRNGKRTGETKHITVNAVVTWTPGDVNVAKKKGGLVSIVSTAQYSSQMPCVIIGIDKWMKANRSTVEGMLAAVGEAGDALKTSEPALQRASQISADVYKEKGTDAAYWEKYYKGTQEPDATGIPVDLGGSSVCNLAEDLLTFGLVQGSANLFAATYTVFGAISQSQYPALVGNLPSAEAVTDTSYLKDLTNQGTLSPVVLNRAKPTYDPGKLKTTISHKVWHIPFNTGSANFSPAAMSDLKRLRQDLLVASGAVVEIHGHTDNQGDPHKNMDLSEARAFAVASWLHKQFPVNFPEGRVRVFAHGQENPIAPNSTGPGRAANRRVEVVIGTTQS